MNREFLKFLLTGGVAAIVNFGSRFVFSLWTSYGVAVVLAYLCGMVTAFVLARLFVFTETDRSVSHSAAWFTVINLFGLAQTYLVSIGLVRWVFPHVGYTWNAEAIAHAIGIMVPVVTSYLGHKHLSFKVAA